MTDGLTQLTDACVHCGFCLPSCPTYQLTGEEAHSPRGRIHLLRQMLAGESTADDIADPIDTCLGCLACVPACPSGVKYEEIIEAGRELVADARPIRERAARAAMFQVLPYPRRLKLSTAPLRAAPALSNGRLAAALRIVASKVDPLFEAAAELMPATGDRPPARALPRRIPARGEQRAVVGLLTGCAQAAFFRHVTAATARVLALEGCEVLVPRGQGCCGALSLHAGRADQARHLARRVVAAFTRAGVDVVITDVAGCGSAMKGYARLLANDDKWAAKAARLAANVRDVSEFLVDLGPTAERSALPMTVAYHDACHLANGQAIRSQPRQLLADIPDLRVVELADGGRCCGSAGTYNLTEPETAAELGDRKAAAVMATSASVVAAGNPGCLLQIDAALRRSGSPIRTKHTIEIVDASLRGHRI
ncbi:MAG TPA: (Fe-S)-binding protein [Micromonosporaceae bacterium]|nr:(Fe-S)-binding protein [Micromonosporaceae bacterium]